MRVVHRLFFGVRPPEVIARDMAVLPLVSGWPRRPNRWDRIHMTLALTDDLFEMPDAVISAYADVGAAIAAASFRLAFDRAVATDKLLILLASQPLPEVECFQKILVRAIAHAGLPLRKGVRFNPHITLSYQRGQPFDRPIDSFNWQAQEFVLIHSHVGLTRHDLVERWKLSGYPPQSGEAVA